ncbi:MAG: potassium transporter KtrB [Ruminococcus sp.]|nr:potassium transporter KtrB [Ruminococcus sp.]
MKKRFFSLSTSQIIMLSFLLTILVGSILLALPVSSATNEAVPYIDALFTATTSTCVTGLVTLTTASSWSTFGHIVILCLIQAGGLGIITILSGIMIILQKRMGLADRILLQDAFNLNSLSGLVKFVKRVFIGTFIVEITGALLYMIVFVPEFGAKGIWISLFTSVSAFCNAGIDIIGSNSLCNYATHPLINTVTALLIILGGLGYVVWWDLLRVTKNFKKQKLRCFQSLTLHSKLVLTATAVLILAGALFIFVFEFGNPLTIGNMSLFDKIQVSLFQSITTRTAGFASVPQENLSNGSAMVSLFLMFIGGSPVGTAGGVKTVTIVVLLASALATVRNRNEVTLFNRNLRKEAVSKAIAVTATSFATLFISTLLLCASTNANALNILFETVSATATVGLSRNLTPYLDTFGKLVITATMYLGRIGPISLAVAFTLRKENKNIISNPTEKISVG